MSELTPSLPPEEEEEVVVGELGEGEMLGGNVEVDHTPLQEQLARNKECKYDDMKSCIMDHHFENAAQLKICKVLACKSCL